MVADFRSIEKQTNPYARRLLIVGAVGVATLFLVYFTPIAPGIQAPLAPFLPLFSAYGVALALLIFRSSPLPLPKLPFWGGSLFVAGGAAFDGVATLVKSPALDLESNPIVRTLLDSGFSLGFVISYGVVSQIAYVVFVCALWAAFLKHKDVFLALVKGGKEQSGLEFIKAAMGGAHLSWRQFLFPLSIKELPTSYYTVWMVPVLLVGGSLYRWYLGFDWLGLLSLPPILALSVSIGVPFTGYVVWLWMEFQKTKRVASPI